MYAHILSISLLLRGLIGTIYNLKNASVLFNLPFNMHIKCFNIHRRQRFHPIFAQIISRMGVIMRSLISTFSGVCNEKRTASDTFFGFKANRGFSFNHCWVSSVSTKPGEMFCREKIKNHINEYQSKKILT